MTADQSPAQPGAGPAEPGAGRPEPKHGLRIFLIWLVAAVVCDLLLWFVLGPHMPPGAMSSSAASQQFDINVMAVMAAPVMLFVLVYFCYALVVWRQREGDETDGPPIHGNTRISITWIAATAVIVLGLFVFGTVELVVPAGAGAGEGPAPIWKPNGSVPLQVQVIAQQWIFTYRYPQFGGMETTELVLPLNRDVQFNVTSLDVIHSFWAYQLGVKADANPGVNNVAYTKPRQLGQFRVHCAELCGVFHGGMTNVGVVETAAQFQAWGVATQAELADVTRILPPYAPVYDPTVVPNIGKALVKLGITGANGNYYPPQDPYQP
jgi:cytochrome c oxidase subunit II